MAALGRIVGRQSCRLILRQFNHQNKLLPAVCISTSKKNRDEAIIVEKIPEERIVKEKLAEKEENWISFGYSLTNRDEDEWVMNMYLLLGVTLVLCWGGFIIAYMPDFKSRNWTQREGYLELARREALGLPQIDPNLIDPSKIELPSDEELGDTDIII